MSIPTDRMQQDSLLHPGETLKHLDRLNTPKIYIYQEFIAESVSAR